MFFLFTLLTSAAAQTTNTSEPGCFVSAGYSTLFRPENRFDYTWASTQCRYPRNISGTGLPRCACDFGLNVSVDKGDYYAVTCNGSGTTSLTVLTGPQGTDFVLPSCPSDVPRCVGFSNLENASYAGVCLRAEYDVGEVPFAVYAYGTEHVFDNATFEAVPDGSDAFIHFSRSGNIDVRGFDGNAGDDIVQQYLAPLVSALNLSTASPLQTYLQGVTIKYPDSSKQHDQFTATLWSGNAGPPVCEVGVDSGVNENFPVKSIRLADYCRIPPNSSITTRGFELEYSVVEAWFALGVMFGFTDKFEQTQSKNWSHYFRPDTQAENKGLHDLVFAVLSAVFNVFNVSPDEYYTWGEYLGVEDGFFNSSCGTTVFPAVVEEEEDATYIQICSEFGDVLPDTRFLLYSASGEISPVVVDEIYVTKTNNRYTCGLIPYREQNMYTVAVSPVSEDRTITTFNISAPSGTVLYSPFGLCPELFSAELFIPGNRGRRSTEITLKNALSIESSISIPHITSCSDGFIWISADDFTIEELWSVVNVTIPESVTISREKRADYIKTSADWEASNSSNNPYCILDEFVRHSPVSYIPKTHESVSVDENGCIQPSEQFLSSGFFFIHWIPVTFNESGEFTVSGAIVVRFPLIVKLYSAIYEFADYPAQHLGGQRFYVNAPVSAGDSFVAFKYYDEYIPEQVPKHRGSLLKISTILMPSLILKSPVITSGTVGTSQTSVCGAPEFQTDTGTDFKPACPTDLPYQSLFQDPKTFQETAANRCLSVLRDKSYASIASCMDTLMLTTDYGRNQYSSDADATLQAYDKGQQNYCYYPGDLESVEKESGYVHGGTSDVRRVQLGVINVPQNPSLLGKTGLQYGDSFYRDIVLPVSAGYQRAVDFRPEWISIMCSHERPYSINSGGDVCQLYDLVGLYESLGSLTFSQYMQQPEWKGETNTQTCGYKRSKEYFTEDCSTKATSLTQMCSLPVFTPATTVPNTDMMKYFQPNFKKNTGPVDLYPNGCMPFDPPMAGVRGSNFSQFGLIGMHPKNPPTTSYYLADTGLSVNAVGKILVFEFDNGKDPDNSYRYSPIMHNLNCVRCDEGPRGDYDDCINEQTVPFYYLYSKNDSENVLKVGQVEPYILSSVGITQVGICSEKRTADNSVSSEQYFSTFCNTTLKPYISTFALNEPPMYKAPCANGTGKMTQDSLVLSTYDNIPADCRNAINLAGTLTGLSSAIFPTGCKLGPALFNSTDSTDDAAWVVITYDQPTIAKPGNNSRKTENTRFDYVTAARHKRRAISAANYLDNVLALIASGDPVFLNAIDDFMSSDDPVTWWNTQFTVVNSTKGTVDEYVNPDGVFGSMFTYPQRQTGAEEGLVVKAADSSTRWDVFCTEVDLAVPGVFLSEIIEDMGRYNSSQPTYKLHRKVERTNHSLITFVIMTPTACRHSCNTYNFSVVRNHPGYFECMCTDLELDAPDCTKPPCDYVFIHLSEQPPVMGTAVNQSDYLKTWFAWNQSSYWAFGGEFNADIYVHPSIPNGLPVKRFYVDHPKFMKTWGFIEHGFSSLDRLSLNTWCSEGPVSQSQCAQGARAQACIWDPTYYSCVVRKSPICGEYNSQETCEPEGFGVCVWTEKETIDGLDTIETRMANTDSSTVFGRPGSRFFECMSLTYRTLLSNDTITDLIKNKNIVGKGPYLNKNITGKITTVADLSAHMDEFDFGMSFWSKVAPGLTFVNNWDNGNITHYVPPIPVDLSRLFSPGIKMHDAWSMVSVNYNKPNVIYGENSTLHKLLPYLPTGNGGTVYIDMRTTSPLNVTCNTHSWPGIYTSTFTQMITPDIFYSQTGNSTPWIANIFAGGDEPFNDLACPTPYACTNSSCSEVKTDPQSATKLRSTIFQNQQKYVYPLSTGLPLLHYCSIPLPCVANFETNVYQQEFCDRQTGIGPYVKAGWHMGVLDDPCISGNECLFFTDGEKTLEQLISLGVSKGITTIYVSPYALSTLQNIPLTTYNLDVTVTNGPWSNWEHNKSADENEILDILKHGPFNLTVLELYCAYIQARTSAGKTTLVNEHGETKTMDHDSLLTRVQDFETLVRVSSVEIKPVQGYRILFKEIEQQDQTGVRFVVQAPYFSLESANFSQVGYTGTDFRAYPIVLQGDALYTSLTDTSITGSTLVAALGGDPVYGNVLNYVDITGLNVTGLNFTDTKLPTAVFTFARGKDAFIDFTVSTNVYTSKGMLCNLYANNWSTHLIEDIRSTPLNISSVQYITGLELHNEFLLSYVNNSAVKCAVVTDNLLKTIVTGHPYVDCTEFVTDKYMGTVYVRGNPYFGFFSTDSLDYVYGQPAALSLTRGQTVYYTAVVSGCFAGRFNLVCPPTETSSQTTQINSTHCSNSTGIQEPCDACRMLGSGITIAGDEFIWTQLPQINGSYPFCPVPNNTYTGMYGSCTDTLAPGFGYANYAPVIETRNSSAAIYAPGYVLVDLSQHNLYIPVSIANNDIVVFLILIVFALILFGSGVMLCLG